PADPFWIALPLVAGLVSSASLPLQLAITTTSGTLIQRLISMFVTYPQKDCERRCLSKRRSQLVGKSGPRHPPTPLPLLPSGPGGVHSISVTRDHKWSCHAVMVVAEREGFEPSVPFSTHDFQSCTFGHSITPPRWRRGPSVNCGGGGI